MKQCMDIHTLVNSHHHRHGNVYMKSAKWLILRRSSC